MRCYLDTKYFAYWGAVTSASKYFVTVQPRPRSSYSSPHDVSLYADAVLKVWSHIVSSLPSVTLLSSKHDCPLLPVSGNLTVLPSYYSERKNIITIRVDKHF